MHLEFILDVTSVHQTVPLSIQALVLDIGLTGYLTPTTLIRYSYTLQLQMLYFLC